MRLSLDCGMATQFYFPSRQIMWGFLLLPCLIAQDTYTQYITPYHSEIFVIDNKSLGQKRALTFRLSTKDSQIFKEYGHVIYTSNY